MTQLTIAKGQQPVGIRLDKLNRHGFIAGATGTGKTVTLKVLAEQLSLAGVPVFLADIKGDLSGLAKEGELNEKIKERLDRLNMTDYETQRFPVRFWDVFGEEGHPIRTTISEMGPLMLGRLLSLNDTQMGVLNSVFKIADDKGYLLIDLKDLQALLKEVADKATLYTSQYGYITKQSVGAIQRNLLVLEQQGAHLFFGEPALQLQHFMEINEEGKGIINSLSAVRLFQSPILYATFLLWLLSELYENLPEVGDIDKPKFVFFFDEAHLLFKDAPKAFVEKIEQVVRLIRSKGVGIFFITQNPMDIPETILAQLGNRVQHALRAYTPKEIKAVKVLADTFRQNKDIKVDEVITQLQVGEALISVLNEQGQPSVVEKALIYPPMSQLSVLNPLEKLSIINHSPLESVYRDTVDRESAYEMLARKVETEAAQQRESQEQKQREKYEKEQEKIRQKEQKDYEKQRNKKQPKSPIEKAAESFISSAVRTLGRELARGILGSLTGGKKKR